MFEPSATGNGGMAPSAASRDRRAARAGAAVPSSRGVSEEEGELLESIPLDPAVDAAALRLAAVIGGRLRLRRPRRDVTARRGSGQLVSVRYAGGSDDIDLDATLEQLVEHPIPEDDDIIVRERVGTRRSVVLAVDVSGSMRGERVRTAAATVGALAGQLSGDDLGVLAFWSDAALIGPIGVRQPPATLLRTLLRIPARGLTNVSFPLEIGRRELARRPARDARVLLLSDCVHNAGPDPRLAAARLPRLDVLLDASGEHDLDLARDLAGLGRGHLAVVRSHREVAPALSRIFDAG